MRQGPGPGDRIRLVGLRGRGHHGVLARERAEGQDFLVDLELVLDTRAAAATDELGHTVDYGRVASDAVAVVEGEPVALLETLAARLADRCLLDPRVEQVTVTVHKPQAPIPVPFDDVTVTITRRRT